MHGAKIYKDYQSLYAIKVEDHPFDFNQAPWVNFQDDQFMGWDGCMYLKTKNLEDMDPLGNLVPREEKAH